MKVLLSMLIALGLSCALQAQAPGQYTPDQLDQMLGPIALYPDPLIALILPASTVPSDITKAAQFLASNGDPSQIDAQPWDPSVKGLAHYPDVVKWMNDNLEWTQALGAAFAMQPADIMKSVQQLRAKAKAAGSLTDTPQQQVDIEGDDIRIVPTNPDQIYPPQYDSDVVYDVPDGYSGPFLTFGVGYPVGPWLGFECDWDDFGIWAGPWHPGWGYRRDWRDPHWGGSRWRIDPARGHALVRNFYRPGGGFAAPRPMAGARGPAGRPGEVRGGGGRGSVTITHSAPDYRGYAAPRTAEPSHASPLFGGYSRGTQARDYSNRGHASRQAPVRRAAPAARAPSARGGGSPGQRR